WIADGANDARAEVLLAADPIEHPIGDGVVEHAVDRKIAPLHVLFGSAKSDAVGMAAIAVAAVVAKGGHLHLPRAILADAARRQDHNHAEGRSHGQRPPSPEKPPDLLG